MTKKKDDEEKDFSVSENTLEDNEANEQGTDDLEAQGFDVEGSKAPDGVNNDDEDIIIPDGWQPDMTGMAVTSRKMPENEVQMPSVNLGGMAVKPANASNPGLTEEQKRAQASQQAQQALIDQGAQYAGKDLKQLMKENPSIRPVAMMQAINAYNKANGQPEMDYLDSLAFFGGNDPAKSRDEVRKDKRKMMWAEGINGIADVLQNVVNLTTASDNSKHNSADMTNYHRQLRKNLDEQRVKRLGDLMAQIKADNDAKRAAAMKEREFQNAIALKQFEMNSPKMALELRKLEADIEVAGIKKQVEMEKLIQERLISAGMPEKLAAELAKIKADEIVRKNQAGYYGAKANEAGQNKGVNDAKERYYNAEAEKQALENFRKRGGDRHDSEAFQRYLKTGEVD